MSAPLSQPQPEAPVCYAHPDRPAYVRCQRCGRPICGPDMIQAAVGYQCPSCVRDGNRGMRRVSRAAGFGRSLRDVGTTSVLIAINVVVWLAMLVTGGGNSRLLPTLSLHRASFCLVNRADGLHTYAAPREAVCQALGGSWSPGVFSGGWYQLITSAFAHEAVLHIGFNMLALWMLGPGLERLFGRARFLLVYVGSALIGNLAVALLSAPQTMSLGASGALFGLMGALLLAAVKYHGDVRGILTWIALNAVITVMGGAAISWEAHLGGFLGGLLFGALCLWGPRPLRAR